MLHADPTPLTLLCATTGVRLSMSSSIARYAHLLQGDDLTELDALKKIDEVLCLRVLAKKDRQAVTVEQYLGLVSAAHYPDYLSYGSDLVMADLAMAREQIERIFPAGFGGCFPPRDWLQSKNEP